MADVVDGLYLSIGGSQRTDVEEWTLNPGQDIHESRPSGATGVNKDGGMSNDTITGTAVDTSYALFQYLYNNRGTKVAYEARFDDAAVSASNPKMTGNAVLELGSVPAPQGGIVRFPFTLHCDGAPALATS